MCRQCISSLFSQLIIFYHITEFYHCSEILLELNKLPLKMDLTSFEIEGCSESKLDRDILSDIQKSLKILYLAGNDLVDVSI